MMRLLRDRYVAFSSEDAWDLTTGTQVAIDTLPDDDVLDRPPLSALVEVLDHGREAVPRWVVLDAPPGESVAALTRRAAADGRARGFVPIGVDLYMRLRDMLRDELRERTLLLIAHPRLDMAIARDAFVDAAAQNPRPHVLLTFKGAPVRLAGGASAVREARAVFGVSAARVQPAIPEDVAQHLRRASRASEFVAAGRHAAAERLLRDVTAALVRRRATAAAATTLLRLGRLLLERGRATEAERTFAEAAAHAQLAAEPATAQCARVWQAAARVDARQLSAAEALCRAVLVAGVPAADVRAHAQAVLARTLLWQGRVEEAAVPELTDEDTVGRVPPKADPPTSVPPKADPPDDDVYARATAVRLLIARGELFEAGRMARDLLERTDDAADEMRLIALTAHARVLATTGDSVLVRDVLREARALARRSHLPLRLVRVRLIVAHVLRRSDRPADARRELRWLQRVRRAATPLLKAAIDERLAARPVSGGSEGPARDIKGARRAGPVDPPGVQAAAVRLVRMAQDEEQDREAVRRILVHLQQTVAASRVELCSADAGPVSVVLGVGAGPATHIGSRVLDLGLTMHESTPRDGTEAGAPVRSGSRLLGAIVARWPLDRSAPAGVVEMLEMAAAVAAPRVEAMTAGVRLAAETSVAVPELVGVSAAVADVRRAIARAATAPFAVLIEGESGAGKELVARAIHQLGPRRERRFCDVNCAALPDDLLESELFGHARGAFTGAVTERRGLFEEADGGTIFLDEVADLSARAQAKLLRVVQQQEVRRVGEGFSRAIDVRIVSAANRDMRAEAAAGRFRQDLLYRLDVLRVRVAPLRERPEDIAVLAEHFWRSAAARVSSQATLTHGVLAALARYHWPGNVRELQNAIAALAVAAPSRGVVRASLLPAAITGAAAVTAGRLADARAQFERRFVEAALARAGGSRTRAARELGISRQGLLKILTRLGPT